MSSKRLLKKEIRIVCGSMAGECVVARISVPGIDVEKMNQVILEIASLQENALSRVSFTFSQGTSSFATVKEYNKARSKFFKDAYRKLKNDFNHRVVEIVKEMNALLPQAQKDANRAAAAK